LVFALVFVLGFSGCSVGLDRKVQFLSPQLSESETLSPDTLIGYDSSGLLVNPTDTPPTTTAAPAVFKSDTIPRLDVYLGDDKPTRPYKTTGLMEVQGIENDSLEMIFSHLKVAAFGQGAHGVMKIQLGHAERETGAINLLDPNKKMDTYSTNTLTAATIRYTDGKGALTEMESSAFARVEKAKAEEMNRTEIEVGFLLICIPLVLVLALLTANSKP
jgi:hypothetical protein